MILGSSDGFDIAMASLMVSLTVATVWIIAHYWHKTRVAAYNARLKQLMIERGMSAEDIERVLKADGRLDAGRPSRGQVVVGIGQAPDEACCLGERDAKRARC